MGFYHKRGVPTGGDGNLDAVVGVYLDPMIGVYLELSAFDRIAAGVRDGDAIRPIPPSRAARSLRRAARSAMPERGRATPQREVEDFPRQEAA